MMVIGNSNERYIYIYLSRVKKRVENVPFVNFNFVFFGFGS